MVQEKNVARFNADVAANEGYLYTRGSLSGRLSNKRISDCVASLVDLKGKRVMDLGCGDGTYTLEFLDLGAAEVVGTDAAATAVKAAASKHKGKKRLRFEVLDVYNAKAPKKPYDVMVVRGLLHHLYNVEGAIAALAPLAKTVVVVEPNGYNPVLKLIERTSRYHIEHEEKSYPPSSLDAWFQRHGGRVVARRYIGLVPFFCPDWAARLLKALEPLVEALPLLRQVGCAQYVQKIEFDDTPQAAVPAAPAAEQAKGLGRPDLFMLGFVLCVFGVWLFPRSAFIGLMVIGFGGLALGNGFGGRA